MGIEQKELWELLPGAAGGRELARLKGRQYFVDMGQRGGKATKDRYGTDYLKELAQRGREANRKRYHSQARTVHPWYGGTERRIPYWPLGQQNAANVQCIFLLKWKTRSKMLVEEYGAHLPE